MFISKLKASLTHFIISLIVFSSFTYVLYYLWFPEPYFSATGGWQGLRITALIDLVLGPFLTFIVYNKLKPKKELIIDLSFIIAFQFSALFFGIYTISQQRPVAIAFWETSFFTVPVDIINKHYANDPFAKTLLNNPHQFYYAQKPQTIEGLKQMFQKSNELKIPQHFQIELYKDFKTHFKDIKKFSVNIQEIIDTNATMKEDILNILKKSNTKLHDNVYIALKSKYHNIILVFNQSAQLLGYAKAPYFK